MVSNVRQWAFKRENPLEILWLCMRAWFVCPKPRRLNFPKQEEGQPRKAVKNTYRWRIREAPEQITDAKRMGKRCYMADINFHYMGTSEIEDDVENSNYPPAKSMFVVLCIGNHFFHLNLNGCHLSYGLLIIYHHADEQEASSAASQAGSAPQTDNLRPSHGLASGSTSCRDVGYRSWSIVTLSRQALLS